MLRYSIILRFIAVMLALPCLVSISNAQSTPSAPVGVAVYNAKEMVAALPVSSDLVGFKLLGITAFDAPSQVPSPVLSRAVIGSTRRSDGFVLNIHVGISPDEKEALEAPFLMVPSSERHPAEGTFSGRRIGKKAWATPNKRALYVVDGRASVVARLSPPFLRDDFNRPYPAALTQEDLLFAENKVIETLHRLRAMGITSESAEGAPEWAKKQVAERLAAIRAK